MPTRVTVESVPAATERSIKVVTAVVFVAIDVVLSVELPPLVVVFVVDESTTPANFGNTIAAARELSAVQSHRVAASRLSETYTTRVLI